MIARSLTRMDGMRKLIADLLDLTQIESGQKNRELAQVDLAAAAASAIEAVAAQAAQRAVTVELHSAGPLVISADAREIEIIFNNLLTNAIKYNRDGGRVDVALRCTGKQAVIAVSDTGIGMSEEERQAALRRIRADPQRKDAPHSRQRAGPFDRQETGPALRRRRDRWKAARTSAARSP